MTDRMDPEQLKRFTAEASKMLADQGLLIKAGWVGYHRMVLPPDTPQAQIDECRTAFMAGAQHVFSSILAIVDLDAEPTAADLRKMDLIDKELCDFAREMQQRFGKAKP